MKNDSKSASVILKTSLILDGRRLMSSKMYFVPPKRNAIKDETTMNHESLTNMENSNPLMIATASQIRYEKTPSNTDVSG